MSILVQNVHKLYQTQKALNDVSFSINSGEIVGFIGPNGAGKSTMMKIITGVIPQTSGNVIVNNMDTREYDLDIRKIIGYLPENNPLYYDMFVKEYLDYVSGIYKIKGLKKKERISEIIELTGLQKEQHKKIGALSKGYKQRVGLAQALIHDPKILILDEPTTGLDPNQIVEIRNLISDLGKEKTVMLSTHLMQEVEAICDRVIIINQGEIVADDTSKNIQKKNEQNLQTVLIEFNESVEIKTFEEQAFISKAVKIENNSFLIEGNSKEDIRPLLFKLAVDNSWTILSIQLKEKSLEEAFRELTQ